MTSKDTAPPINPLQRQDDLAALALIQGHPPARPVRLALGCVPPAAHATDTGLELTGQSVGMQCTGCGALFPVPHAGSSFYCPACAASTCDPAPDWAHY